MGKSTRVNTKTPKKRAEVTGELVGVRLQPDMAQRLDDWRRMQDDLPGRPESIRRLLEIALKATPKARPIERALARAAEFAAKAKA